VRLGDGVGAPLALYPTRILLATDGSEESASAVRTAGAFRDEDSVAVSHIRAVTAEVGYEDLKTVVDTVVGQARIPYS
jgi:hypothetical protein